MSVLTNAVRSLQQIQRQLPALAIQVLKEHTAEIEDAVREQHLAGESTAAQDEPLGIYRNPLYARMKHMMNSAAGYGVVDLELTGAFHDSIRVTVTRSGVTITASDPKTKELLEKYGDDILNLNAERRQQFIDDILRPYYAERVREKLLQGWKS